MPRDYSESKIYLARQDGKVLVAATTSDLRILRAKYSGATLEFLEDYPCSRPEQLKRRMEIIRKRLTRNIPAAPVEQDEVPRGAEGLLREAGQEGGVPEEGLG